MDSFALLWLFDTRWLCRLRASFYEHVLLLPILANLVFLTGILAFRHTQQCSTSHSPQPCTILICSFFLVALELYMYTCLLIKRRKAIEHIGMKLKPTPPNSCEILDFLRHFEARKAIWSWNGLLIVCIQVFLLIIEWYQASLFDRCHGGLSLQLHFYLNQFFAFLLAGVIGTFLVVKLGYLFVAWKHSEDYLRYRRVYI